MPLITDNEFILNDLTPGTAYAVEVRAVDAAGNESAPGGKSFTTLAATPSNIAPMANAGADQSITQGQVLTLSGSGTDADGTIVAYQWSKVSGGAATIESPNSATTAITNYDAGNFVFRLTVTDNSGATATDDIAVTVQAAAYVAPLALDFDELHTSQYTVTNGEVDSYVNPVSGKAFNATTTTSKLKVENGRFVFTRETRLYNADSIDWRFIHTLQEGYTVAARILPTDLTERTQSIIGNANASSHYGGWFGIDTRSSSSKSRAVTAAVYGSGSPKHSSFNGASYPELNNVINFNQYNTVVYTIVPQKSGGYARIRYRVNGVLVLDRVFDYLAVSGSVDQNGYYNFSLGALAPGNTFGFAGGMPVCRVYRGEATAEQIAQIETELNARN